jgi:phage FluMu protein Com
MSQLTQFRCPHCNKLVAEVSPSSTVRSKCPRCKSLVEHRPSSIGPGTRQPS